MLPIEKRISTYKQLQETLKLERSKYRCKWGELAYFLRISEKAILWHHMILLRKAEYHINAHHQLRGILYRLLLKRLQLKYSLSIPLNTCEAGLKIMHLGPILINGNAQIGKNCVLHVYTALVAKGISNQAPILGDGVVVGVGATIVGGVRIAKNVAIGANSVVVKDVLEANIAVAGIPAKKVSNSGRLAWEMLRSQKKRSL